MKYPIDRSLPTSPTIYNYTRGGCAVEWIVVHYTANPGSAWAHAEYCRRGGSGASSWHYVIDAVSIYQGVPEECTAWHAGNADFNRRSIGIEVVSDGEDFNDGEVARLRDLVHDLMQRYGIAPDHVIRHYDVADRYTVGSIVSPHKCCPAPYAPNGGDPSGAKWAALHRRITAMEIGDLIMLEFIGRANESEPLIWYNGHDYIVLKSQEDSEAVQSVYRQATGCPMPMVLNPGITRLKALVGEHR